MSKTYKIAIDVTGAYHFYIVADNGGSHSEITIM